MLVNGIEKMSKGLSREFQRLDLLSHNLANAETPGFRSYLYGNRQGEVDRWLNKSPAPLEVTERELDISPAEGTFFSVFKDGRVQYTQRGDLTVNDKGILTLGSGEPILSQQGQQITVDLSKPIQIGTSGDVVQDGREVAKISRYSVTRPQGSAGSVIFSIPPEVQPQASEQPILRGTLSVSDVNAERETVNLSEALGRARLFEAFARVQDQTVDQAIRDLGSSR